MKKHLFVTLILSILMPGAAKAMGTKLIREALDGIKKYQSCRRNLSKSTKRLEKFAPYDDKNYDDNAYRVEDACWKLLKCSSDDSFENMQKSIENLPKKINKKLLRKKLDLENWSEILKEELRTVKKRRRTALVLAPTILAGAGLATWYFWDKKPVTTIKNWLSKIFASWHPSSLLPEAMPGRQNH